MIKITQSLTQMSVISSSIRVPVGTHVESMTKYCLSESTHKEWELRKFADY